jgi:ubiquinone/menaquinone biosynthesis C-methylase UbiE
MHEKRFNGESAELRYEKRRIFMEVDRVIDLALKGIDAESMVDVGTGSGLFAEAFQERGMQIAGVDVSQEMLDLAAQHIPGAILRLGTAEKLPFSDSYSDLVFMGMLLHETDEPLQALKEALRVGSMRTVVLEWYYDDHQEFGPPLEHRLSEKMIRDWSVQAGFARITTHTLTNLMLYILDVE